MTYEIILDNESAILRYHLTDNYIYHTIKKDIGGPDILHLLDVGLDTLINKGSGKWLADDRLNGPVEFVVNDWGRRAAEAGWRYWALVVPEDIAGRASMVDVVNAYLQVGVSVRVFSDVEEAREWLVAQP